MEIDSLVALKELVYFLGVFGNRQFHRQLLQSSLKLVVSILVVQQLPQLQTNVFDVSGAGLVLRAREVGLVEATLEVGDVGSVGSQLVLSLLLQLVLVLEVVHFHNIIQVVHL